MAARTDLDPATERRTPLSRARVLPRVRAQPAVVVCIASSRGTITCAQADTDYGQRPGSPRPTPRTPASVP